MKNVLNDIKTRLINGEYKNEEHVRLNIVARMLSELGWNIWDPNEVNAEFNVAPDEDNTKVDIAVFVNKYSPTIFIEVKAVGRIDSSLSDTERQLRNYNRNQTALFSIITDGRKWQFYYSQTGGEFSKKCFKTIDILAQDPEDIELSFLLFLSKEEINSGRAKCEAEKYLKLSQEQRVMEDSLPEAKRLIQEPPYPSLPDCLVSLVV